MILDSDQVAIAIHWAWSTALQSGNTRGAMDEWHDIAERLHGMRLMLATADDTPERAELIAAVDTLDDLAAAHYDAIADAVIGSVTGLPWEAA